MCVEYSDEEFHKYIHNLPEGYERVKGEDGAGVIKYNGEVVATYTRPYVDFGSPFAEGVVSDLSRRAPATVRLMTYGAAISASIIIAPVAADVFGTMLAESAAARLFQGTAERIVSNPNIMGHIFRGKHLLGPLVRQLGSERAVVEAVVAAVKGAQFVEGKNEVTVKVANAFVTVQVFVRDGVAKINDFWVPR